MSDFEDDFDLDEAELEELAFIEEQTPERRRLVQMTLDGRRAAETAQVNSRPGTGAGQSSPSGGAFHYAQARFRDRQAAPTHHALDPEAIKTWVFPTNFTQRDYQYNMILKALFANVLIALPTGLGKTFIAAVVMVNWYRWAPKSKIFFLAPTRPLVNQQLDACYQICAIPARDMAEMTGKIPSAKREAAYRERRIFFMTPQTFANDLRDGLVDGKEVSCLVIDEAHHATGNWSYVGILQHMKKVSQSFRVLALTATPGRTVETVQEVVDNLLISHIEMRNDESLDIRAYVHKKDVETIVLDYNDVLLEIQNTWASLIKPDLDRLRSMGVGCTSDTTKISGFAIRDAVQKFCLAARSSGNPNGNAARAIGNHVATCAASMALLNEHGIRPFYKEVKGMRDSLKGSKLMARIVHAHPFREMMSNLEDELRDPNFTGHPKLDYLNGIVLNHFQQAAETGETQTRVMIFSSLRASTEVIIASLQRHHPLVKATAFYGQSKGKEGTGMRQDEQARVIQQYKAGVYNVLVATSVAEEGLDIGEIDMIICYDTSSSPARMLQRMGRTGRKRQGQVYVLCTKGKEEQAFLKAKDAHRVMQIKIASGKDIKLVGNSPRILPWDVNPVCVKEHFVLPADDEPDDRELKKTVKRTRKTKVFAMPEGVERGFIKAHALAKAKPFRLDDELMVLQPTEGLLDAAGEAELRQRFQVSGVQYDNAGERIVEDGCFPHVQGLYSLDTTGLIAHSQACIDLIRMVGQEWRPARLQANSKRWMHWQLEGYTVPELSDDDGEGDFGQPVQQTVLKVLSVNQHANGAASRSVAAVPNKKRGRKCSDSDTPLKAQSKKRPASHKLTLAKENIDVEHLFSDDDDEIEAAFQEHLTIESSPERVAKRRRDDWRKKLDEDSDEELPDVADFGRLVASKTAAVGVGKEQITPSAKQRNPVKAKVAVPTSATRRSIHISDDEDDD